MTPRDHLNRGDQFAKVNRLLQRQANQMDNNKQTPQENLLDSVIDQGLERPTPPLCRD